MSNGDSGIRILNINVKDEDIFWTLDRGDMKGFSQKITGSSEPLDLTQQHIDSIELLVTMLQLLTDLSREQSLDLADPDKDTLGIVQTIDNLFRVLGGQLFRVLFKGDIHTNLSSLLDDPEIKIVRIQLEFDGIHSARLSTWPWEYLYVPPDEKDPEAGSFLALKTQLMLNRVLTIATKRLPNLGTSLPVRVLVVVASPNPSTHLSPVYGDKVIEVIKELEQKKIVTLKTLLTPEFELSDDYHATVTRDAFQEALKFEPHIVHFIGHGRRRIEAGRGELALLQDSGDVDWVKDEEFAGWVSQCKDLKMVFLQACESALPDPYIGISGVAQEVAKKRVPAVVAMQYKIEEEVAVKFAEKFYETLSTGQPVDMAVKEGREAISGLPQTYAQHRAFGLPVLYLRSFEGMIIQEDLKSGTKQTVTIDTSGGEQQPPAAVLSCPRCGNAVTKFICTRCGLRLFCKECEEPFENPLTDNFCGVCEEPIVQRPWSPDAALERHPAESLFQASVGGQTPKEDEPPPGRPDLRPDVDRRRPGSRSSGGDSS